MGEQYLAMDAAKVQSEVRHILAAYPELAEDEELRLDMLEGSTDLHRIMSFLVRARNEEKADIEGISGYVADLSERQARKQRRIEAYNALMLSLMSVADIPKLVLPEATLSVTKPRVGVEITDLAALPQGTFTLSRQADKAAIKALLDAGDDVPGATLKSGDAGLTVRTK